MLQMQLCCISCGGAMRPMEHLSSHLAVQVLHGSIVQNLHSVWRVCALESHRPGTDARVVAEESAQAVLATSNAR